VYLIDVGDNIYEKIKYLKQLPIEWWIDRKII